MSMRALPNWSGDVLDLVVDFVTYVFVPAYAITASGLLLPLFAPLLGIGIVVSGALYFADRRMKAPDNCFRGFPALWNAAAFYLFLLHWPPALSSLGIALLIALTFVPFHILHPVRVMRLRGLTLSLIGVWALLAIFTLANDFQVGAAVTIGLCAIAAYVVGSDAVIRSNGVVQRMIDVMVQPGSLGGIADPDRAGNRARHRQCHLPVGDRLAHPAGAGEARAPDRPSLALAVPHPAAQPAGMADRDDAGRSLRARHRACRGATSS